MQIYKPEEDIADLIKNNHSTSALLTDNIHSEYSQSDQFYDNPDILNYIKRSLSDDLLLVNGILVTTNWNQNDDVFSPDEVWAAKYTPIFKPANQNHEGKEIDDENKTIGVIFSSHPVDLKYKIISSDINPIPEKFHLLVGIYVWQKYWKSAAEEIKDNLKRNQCYISMECLFKDFGYALKSSNSNEVHLLPRTENTAWLTKHLRMYNGSGTIEINKNTYRIGRWLRNITFSGVGFVKKPANPESIVFTDYITASKKFNDDDLTKEFIDFLNKNSVLDNYLEKKSLWPT